MLIADLDVPAQYLDTQTVHASVDEAADVSDEDEAARDEKQTSQRQVASDQALGQAEHRHQRRHQTTPRQQTEPEKSPDVCGCKGWGGFCRCNHA
jgi:hypothetical protein